MTRHQLLQHYVRVSAVHDVVAGALVRSGRVLLAHRSPLREWYPDVWDLPGGHVEEGESELQALAREVQEELGVQIVEHDPHPLGRVHLAGEGARAGMRLSVWAGRRWRGSPENQRPDEHDELRWVGPGELSQLALAHPGYVELLTPLLAAP